MVSDTEAVQTHFTVTPQLFWQSMTRRRAGRLFRCKWRTWLRAAGITHATGARLRAIFSGGRETCYVLVIIMQWERQDSALRHWCRRPTAAVLMCHAWLSHPSLWGSLSLPGSVFFTQTAKCRENFLASAIRLECTRTLWNLAQNEHFMQRRNGHSGRRGRHRSSLPTCKRDDSAVSNAAQCLKTGSSLQNKIMKN